MAIENNWAGLVVYGAIRDTAIIRNLPIGIHALGKIPSRGLNNGSGEISVPVSFGDVTFVPGQFIYCDDDGIVVLPEEAEPSSHGPIQY